MNPTGLPNERCSSKTNGSRFGQHRSFTNTRPLNVHTGQHCRGWVGARAPCFMCSRRALRGSAVCVAPGKMREMAPLDVALRPARRLAAASDRTAPVVRQLRPAEWGARETRKSGTASSRLAPTPNDADDRSQAPSSCRGACSSAQTERAAQLSVLAEVQCRACSDPPPAWQITPRGRNTVTALWTALCITVWCRGSQLRCSSRSEGRCVEMCQ